MWSHLGTKTAKHFTFAILLLPQTIMYIPKPIQWGRKHEPDACRECTKYMNANDHSGLTARRCGFFVHPLKGWLGASPDALVFDPIG